MYSYIKILCNDTNVVLIYYLCECAHEGAVTVAASLDPHGKLHAPTDITATHHKHAHVRKKTWTQVVQSLRLLDERLKKK